MGAGSSRHTNRSNISSSAIVTAAVNLGPLPPALRPSSMLLAASPLRSQRAASWHVPIIQELQRCSGQSSRRNQARESRLHLFGFEGSMIPTLFAALPFRIRNDEISVLLITTRRKRRWSAPKGWPIAGCGPQQTAEIEAYEEAGLIGRAARSVGRYQHRKQKRKIVCQVELFPLEVSKRKKRWPEKGQRAAVWISATQAAKMVHKPQLRRLILEFLRSKRREVVSPT